MKPFDLVGAHAGVIAGPRRSCGSLSDGKMSTRIRLQGQDAAADQGHDHHQHRDRPPHGEDDRIHDAGSRRLVPDRAQRLRRTGEDEKSQALSITIVELDSLAKNAKQILIETTGSNARSMSAEQSERIRTMQDPRLAAPGTRESKPFID